MAVYYSIGVRIPNPASYRSRRKTLRVRAQSPPFAGRQLPANSNPRWRYHRKRAEKFHDGRKNGAEKRLP